MGKEEFPFGVKGRDGVLLGVDGSFGDLSGFGVGFGDADRFLAIVALFNRPGGRPTGRFVCVSFVAAVFISFLGSFLSFDFFFFI